jgi:hypothetical protein
MQLKNIVKGQYLRFKHRENNLSIDDNAEAADFLSHKLLEVFVLRHN